MMIAMSTLIPDAAGSTPSWPALLSDSNQYAERPANELEVKLAKTEAGPRAVIESALEEMASAPDLPTLGRCAERTLSALPVPGAISGDGPYRNLFRKAAVRVLFGWAARAARSVDSEEEAVALVEGISTLPQLGPDQIFLPSELRQSLPAPFAGIVSQVGPFGL